MLKTHIPAGSNATISVDPVKRNIAVQIDWTEEMERGATSTPTPAPTTAPVAPTVDFAPKKVKHPRVNLIPTLTPSNEESRSSGGTAHLLGLERKRATFNVENLTNFLDGGEKATERRRWIVNTGDDYALGVEKYNMTREELLRQHVRDFIAIHRDFLGKFQPTRQDLVWMSENSTNIGPLMNSLSFFTTTIMNQGSDEQIAQWIPAASRLQVIGCYAQTELGHGSNVRGLRTTATYDKNTQEFILNTPTLRSIKWWPGALGLVATHAVLYAQLIIDGKEHGLHVFIVQIRDENHKVLPGIEVGDVGPKMGDHTTDTGYMIMDNVRIPREYMLCRYQQVTSDGAYVKSEKLQENSKLIYATMMFTRGRLIAQSGAELGKAVTIATRYSCVRQQGFVDTTTEVCPFKKNKNK